MKSTVRLVLTLFLITAISALILSLSNKVTAPVIAEADKLKEDKARMELLPEGETFEILEEDIISKLKESDSNIVDCFKGLKNGETIGYIIKSTTNGYGGSIEFLIGIKEDGKLGGIKVLSHEETAGLGENITKPFFADSFKDKSIDGELVATKQPSQDNEVQAITSATVTTTAMVGEINKIIEAFNMAFE